MMDDGGSPNTEGESADGDYAPAADERTGAVSFQTPDDFLDTFQQMSRDWMACASAEVELGFRYSRRLMAARSIPDAVDAYGEWVNEEMDARAADASRMISHGQKLMDCSSRLLSNGWTRPNATL